MRHRQLYCFFLGIIITIVCSCSKSEEPFESSNVNIPQTIEGCEIKNPETAIPKGVLKTDYIYIYGARTTTDGKSNRLWIAQYSLEHELLAEYIEAYDELPLYILRMSALPNGKYLITSNCGYPQNMDVVEQIPVIFDPIKRELKIRRINSGFFFDEIKVYNDFMLLYPSQREIDLNQKIDPMECLKVQMNYEGDILYKSNNMRIPSANDSILWVNSEEYIVANQTNVTATYLNANRENKWSVDVNNLSHPIIKLSLIENHVKATYEYIEEERKKNKIYHMDLTSGEKKATAEKITTCVDGDYTILLNNKELNLQAKILPSNTFLKGLKYESSDVSIATVSESGMIQSHKNGTCTIYIYSEDGFAEQAILLSVSSLSFTEKAYEVLKGKSKQLEIIADDIISANGFIWKSSDESIAFVNEEGEVRGLKKGKVTITATSSNGELETTCTLEVKDFMDYIEVNTSYSFVGSNIAGNIWLLASVTNHSEDEAEIVSLSLCYEESDEIIKLIEDRKLASNNAIEAGLTGFNIYPTQKPYLKLIMKYEDETVETKYGFFTLTK